MASFGTNFNPSAVMMGQSGSSPYLWTGPSSAPTGSPVHPTTGPTVGPPPAPTAPTSPLHPVLNPTDPSFTTTPPPTPANTLAPESILATGTGPYDAAYRQNLATYAGGQYSRPGGSMTFNPTDPTTFPGMPTGGGNAPVAGMPTSLMDMALGGQGFSWTPPAPAPTATNPGNFQTLQSWMNDFLMNGRSGRMGSIT